jgi:predicted dehydrogenase
MGGHVTTPISTYPLGVGIIGCGLIGQKRANALGVKGKLIACADINLGKAQVLAEKFDAKYMRDWRELLFLPEIKIVIVSTLHDSLAAITMAALEAGKHVLVEKPAARNLQEIEPVLEIANKCGLLVRVGFNHRYHRSLQLAKKIIDSGELGELMFVRARYGHGGRLGYDKEWRSNPELSGGGELIDQGPHLIDLARWFLGDFTQVDGYAHTYYWDMPVDDNAFMTLKTKKNQVAFLHASCTEWKNLFSMEIYGKYGKLDISGLGGSYGLEKLTHYKMLPEMGPPETISWEFPRGDDSWQVEMDEFYEDVRLNRRPSASLRDAKAALEVIQTIYQESGYDYRS